MKNKIRCLLVICLAVMAIFFFSLPAEAVWVAINTSNYNVIGGIGYINPGATLHCYGYHEWPPSQSTTFTFTNGTNSYYATG
ncbi:MAG TPA: hypothetical protein PK467_09065, partial [Candidatus Wallbacteria bacterium]|nr:hypothetical protein [Candidatus Wallbacteria bacterium]